jgi:hypothetical protein
MNKDTKKIVRLGFCKYIRISYMFDDFYLYYCDKHLTKVVFKLTDGHLEYYMKHEKFQMINN